MKPVIVIAWLVGGFIAYATLAHVGFVYAIYYRLAPILQRPEIHAYVRFEHITAFAVLGALFCFAYPRHIALVCAIVFGSAVLLEFLQTLTPDRHGTLTDAIEKIAGGACGVIFAKIVMAVFRGRTGGRIEGPGLTIADEKAVGRNRSP